jgi:hypothetical protein
MQASYVMMEGSVGLTQVQNDGNGIRSEGGSFLRNKSLNFKDFTDGSSNTGMIAEQSGRSFNATGATVDGRADHSDGVWMGIGGGMTNSRCFNTTTHRHPIGANSSTLPGAVGQNCNSPLNSEHTGGIHILMGDGAVKFISNNIDFDLSRFIFTRNDNQVLGEF